MVNSGKLPERGSTNDFVKRTINTQDVISYTEQKHLAAVKLKTNIFDTLELLTFRQIKLLQICRK